MTKIHLCFDEGVPQYVCNSCCSCHSLFGKSLCSIKNRGCCWYYPRFTLHEIHKMVKSSDGLKILADILKLPGIKIYSYYIHAKGYFDETGYSEYLKSGQAYEDDVRDRSIFFRVCPFVKPGTGCTLPAKYRNYVCNFFICREVTTEVEKYSAFDDYIKERISYVNWVEWENRSLEALLRENNVTLSNNFDEVISILKCTPLDNYEFPDLPSIETEDEFSIGA